MGPRFTVIIFGANKWFLCAGSSRRKMFIYFVSNWQDWDVT